MPKPDKNTARRLTLDAVAQNREALRRYLWEHAEELTLDEIQNTIRLHNETETYLRRGLEAEQTKGDYRDPVWTRCCVRCGRIGGHTVRCYTTIEYPLLGVSDEGVNALDEHHPAHREEHQVMICGGCGLETTLASYEVAFVTPNDVEVRGSNPTPAA